MNIVQKNRDILYIKNGIHMLNHHFQMKEALFLLLFPFNANLQFRLQ